MVISCISTSSKANESLFPSSSSSRGRYSTKSIFTSFPSSSPSPTVIKMSPGTIKPKLREVRALSAVSISSRWQSTAMMRMVKQLLMRIITREKICLMRMFPITKLNPSIIPIQNMLGKFQRESTPNTPQNSSKDNSLPPKKQPNQMKLNPMKKFKTRALRNCGSVGATKRQERQRLMPAPARDSKSPQNRERFEQDRQIWFPRPGTTGPVAESYSVQSNPARTSITPALQNSWCCYLRICLRSPARKVWRHMRLKVCSMEVSLTAYLMMRNQTHTAMLAMKFCFSIWVSTRVKRLPPPTAATCRFSYPTKGMVRRAAVRKRQLFCVRPSYLRSDISQQGTMAADSMFASSNAHASRGAISIYRSPSFTSESYFVKSRRWMGYSREQRQQSGSRRIIPEGWLERPGDRGEHIQGGEEGEELLEGVRDSIIWGIIRPNVTPIPKNYPILDLEKQ